MSALVRKYLSLNNFGRSKFASVCIYKYATLSTIAQESPDATSSGVVPIFRRATQFGNRVAFQDNDGDYRYQGLLHSSHKFASEISYHLNGNTQERVAFLCPNNASYLIAQWACWISGQIAVPMNDKHPLPLMEHYVTNSQAKLVVTTRHYAKMIAKLCLKIGTKMLIMDDILQISSRRTDGENIDALDSFSIGLEPEFYETSEALIIYTSGTTGLPKGAVLSHRAIQEQVSSLVQAWGWTKHDGVLHVLPLHHIHGIVNVLTCPLAVGATCVMLPKFDAGQVWRHLLINARVNIFMAVPTIYMKLIEEYENNLKDREEEVRDICSNKIRLMVSGSAALPAPLSQRWADITGHTLLERYGMTETGMVLSNKLEGERRLGYVGLPLPGVEVQISGPNYESLVTGDNSGSVVVSTDHASGELLVRGPTLFSGYYNKPEATSKEFTQDGWFKTGDTARYEDGMYQILGRTSVDIIKTGGYKVSALEIETQLLTHPSISECAVVGLEDDTWGQKVAVIAVLKPGCEVSLSELRQWSKERLASYASPSVLKVIDILPKNVMGKVNKKQLIKELFPDSAQ
uniref:Uncharacterized protein n=1 Tax=Timema monikensis TaxID=170555 RepID=A0A7R9DZF8_9NEOP|nr:unnamed protein product [Timema monikensis]